LPEPLLIGSEIYRGSTYGPKHPLAIPRVSTTLDLIRAMGWLDPVRYLDSPMASPDELCRFHDPAYIAALHRAEATQTVAPEDRELYRIGADGNPVYREVFRRPATSAGGVMLAARITADDGGVIHVPGGGTHHGQRARASGFCYVNDAVLGLLTWLDAGLTRVLYLDIDAHHGDGVEIAFADEPRVTTLSIHEAGRWPFSGQAHIADHALNLPVPQGFNDTEMRALLEGVVLPLIDRLRPEAIMLQCGADALEEDPLAKLSLSNNAHAGFVEAVCRAAPRFLLLGGGGYNPWTVARCWARNWAVLNGLPIPDRLPPEAEEVLRRLTFNRAAGRNPPEHWFTTLADGPREGPVREAVINLIRGTLPEALGAVA
jgi:acetoin utilization protein AcuC